jgi:hypothetical protein
VSRVRRLCNSKASSGACIPKHYICRNELRVADLRLGLYKDLDKHVSATITWITLSLGNALGNYESRKFRPSPPSSPLITFNIKHCLSHNLLDCFPIRMILCAVPGDISFRVGNEPVDKKKGRQAFQLSKLTGSQAPPSSHGTLPRPRILSFVLD